MNSHALNPLCHSLTRRALLGRAAAIGLGCALSYPGASGAESPKTKDLESSKEPGKLHLLKTLKVGMISMAGSLTEKFAAAKEAGFQGVELNAPSFDVDEVRQAIAESGLVVDGSVVGNHWQIRHTDPDPTVRAEALETLKDSIRKTHAVGGHTVLLVLGRGSDGTEAECWQRSMDNIQHAIPVAAEYGIYLAIENVWNQFLYDHDGGPDQSSEKFVRYVDEANSPWVGMQFDIGNHWKYGAVGQWIRELGKRIVKLDIKGFSREHGNFTKIGEDDLPWNDVRNALLEIGYTGWIAAEVKGGGPDRLREISQNIDRVMGLSGH